MEVDAVNNQPLLDDEGGSVVNIQPPHAPAQTHKFQTGQVYKTIEDLNNQAKTGQDACSKLLECLSNLPGKLLEPCSICSACLSVVVLLLYLGGIIWLCFYDIYDIDYKDDANEQQSASVIAQCDEDKALSNEYVCKFYGFESCVDDTADAVASLSKFEMESMVFIKIQYFISWAMYVRLRYIMRDMAMFSVNYAFLIVFCNVISYMFRHLGWIYYSKDCKVMYSPYFSDDFVSAIITFILSFVLWMLLVSICLKRVKARGYGGRTKLVLRWKGNVIDQRREIVDQCSVVANVAIILFFAYAAIGSSLWIGIENYEKSVEKYFDSSSSSSSGFDYVYYTKWANLVELLLTTIVQYFVPKIHWLSIYLFASIASNALLVIDICIFLLKLIRDLVEKCKRKIRNVR